MHLIKDQKPEQDFTPPPGTVRLAGRLLPVIGAPRKMNNGRFPSKVTMGDYSHDSDPILSAWIISSLTGGIGNEHLKEGTDDDTYWTGTLETRFPGQITLLAETRDFGGASEDQARPLGDFPSAAPNFYAAFGTSLERFNAATESFDVIDTLPGAPVNKAVEYDGLLYIPLGINGYATLDDQGTLDHQSDIPVVAFCWFDNKIAALTTSGTIRFKFKTMAWEDPVDGYTLPSGALPRHLVVFKNQQGTPTLHAVTTEGLWAVDRENALLYSTELKYPRHPHQGMAATNWRGEAIYVSVGVGIHAYNGGTVSSMGPDGRYGLPAEFMGTITDLEPEYNALIAVVQGVPVVSHKEQEYGMATGQYSDVLDPYPSVGAHSYILRWSGHAWHPVWRSPGAGGNPSWASVSIADNDYHLWWGYGGRMYRQVLPTYQHTPMQGMRVGTSRFAARGELTSGWFDADMPAFDKLASHVEVVLKDAFGNGTSTGRVKVYYQTDYSTAWTLAEDGGTASRPGRTVLDFRKAQRASDARFSTGMRFRRIRFRLVFESDNPTLSPVLESFQLRFRKIPASSKSWTITVNFSQDEAYGWGPGEMIDFLDALTTDDEFHEFIHRGEAYRVSVAQTTGAEMTALDPRGTMELSLIEIKLPKNDFAPIQGES